MQIELKDEVWIGYKNQRIASREGEGSGGYGRNQEYIKLLEQGGAHGMVASNNSGKQQISGKQQLGVRDRSE